MAWHSLQLFNACPPFLPPPSTLLLSPHPTLCHSMSLQPACLLHCQPRGHLPVTRLRGDGQGSDGTPLSAAVADVQGDADEARLVLLHVPMHKQAEGQG